MNIRRRVGLFLRVLLDILRVRPPAEELRDIEGEALLSVPTGTAPGYVVLSVKFDRGNLTNQFAQQVQYLMGGKDFCYSPNWYTKSECPRDCRGDASICEKPIVDSDGRPTHDSCWRFSYKWHLEKASLMLRVKFQDTYGKGQQEEARMAADLGLPVVQIYSDESEGLFVIPILLPAVVTGGNLVATALRHVNPSAPQLTFCIAYSLAAVGLATYKRPGNKLCICLFLNWQSCIFRSGCFTAALINSCLRFLCVVVFVDGIFLHEIMDASIACKLECAGLQTRNFRGFWKSFRLAISVCSFIFLFIVCNYTDEVPMIREYLECNAWISWNHPSLHSSMPTSSAIYVVLLGSLEAYWLLFSVYYELKKSREHGRQRIFYAVTVLLIWLVIGSIVLLFVPFERVIRCLNGPWPC